MSTTAKKQYDLTQGPILNRLLLVALPIMGTQLMQMAYNLTDMFWLGRVGSDAVAASGTAGMYMWLSMGLMLLGRMGAEIGVSQSMGRQDPDRAARFAQNALTMALVSGLAYGLVMSLLRNPLIGFFQIREAHLAADAAAYLGIAGIGVPFTYLSGAAAGIFNGSGNSRTPFYINCVGLVGNMILDPVLILRFGLGITGAAIATVAAQILVCLLSLAALKWSRGRPFPQFSLTGKPNRALMVQILKWSTPIALESMLFCFLSMIISRFVTAYGAGAIAVQRVGSQIESLSWLIGGGFGTALTAFVGQNFGAHKWARIHKGFRISLVAITCWGVVITLVLFFLGRPLYSLFLPDPAIAAEGAVYLRILASCQIFACFEAVASGAFRGIGRTIPPSAVSVSGNTIRIFIAYFLSLQIGINGIWWGVALGAVLRGAVILGWYLLSQRKMPQEDAPLPQPQPAE